MMPADTTEQSSTHYRDNYRVYLGAMAFLVLIIALMLLLNPSDNWAAIITSLVCLLILAVRLAFARRRWMQTQRAGQSLPQQSSNTNDSFYTTTNNIWQQPSHSRQPDDEFLASEYIVAMEEERLRQQSVYTISARHDPPPDYDSVTKNQRPPSLSRSNHSSHGSSSSQSQHSLQARRSRQETARTISNSSPTNNVPSGQNLSLNVGRIPPSSASTGPGDTGVGADSPQPPSYDEALAARLYQQLGLENR